ncbi:MAG TPA: PilZ domain-containing protein [Deltaproteobacteria bacterium]|nr:PilZ domain-containing protein [Deltaproteobacteria bacterium]
MNIDKLLDLRAGLTAFTAEGNKIDGVVEEIIGEDTFLFKPVRSIGIEPGRLLKISDGRDAVLARVLEHADNGVTLLVESQVKPSDERRQDVRINDKVYLKVRLVGHALGHEQALEQTLEKIRANKLIIDSFLKGQYGYPGADEIPYTRETPTSQAIWELNRKLDLLIHMNLAEDFKQLMQTVPQDVNISASGLRFIADTPYDVMDVLEIGMILPMVPLLFIRLAAQVIRIKTLTHKGRECYSVVVRFIEMDQESKDDIVRYLFRRQREMLRRRQDKARE